jgi:hypothetical protein
VVIPIQWNSSMQTSNLFSYSTLLQSNQTGIELTNKSLINVIQPNGDFDIRQLIFSGLIIIYFIGLVYKAYNFSRNLRSIQKCIKQNPKVREGRFWLVDLIDNVPPFSFFNYIFITNSHQMLSADDLQRIKDHEKVHSRQFHSLDVLFIEFISIIFWLNPLLIYLKKSIQEIHEYIVDEKIAAKGNGKKDYAQLLLKLASEAKGFNLSAGFSGNQIKRRIVMITKQRSLPRYKLMFTILVPITILIMFSFSYIKNPNPLAVQKKQNEIQISNGLKIGDVIWKGNKVFSTKELNKEFGLKKGDNYDSVEVFNRVFNHPGMYDNEWKGNIQDFYLNSGYLFSRMDLTKKQYSGKVDLTITIYESKRAKIGKINIIGNESVPSSDILNKITMKSGDLFNKSKLMASKKAIGDMGKFDPERISPSVKPISFNEKDTDEYVIVDFNFEVTEIKNR